MQFAGGTSKTLRLAGEPDRLVEMWIYPWEELNLRGYFQEDARFWRPASGALPAVRAIRLQAQPYDFFSVSPRTIEIESLDGVTLGMGKAGDQR